ncbi:MAG: hypothetical protein ACHRXM_31715 [Isosphaerales bacterium]
MSDAVAAAAESGRQTSGAETRFDLLDLALRTGGPNAALDSLTEQLDAAGEYRALLDALLLKARHELGLPLIVSGSLAELPEPARSQYEAKYVAAIRLVGSKFLESGDIPTAWAYYRAIGENEPVERAILEYRSPENDERLGALIEIAFNHGVSPRRGFDLILEHYGTCPAISAFEQLPPHEGPVRAACAERLIRHLHRELSATLRAEIASRGQVLPPEGSPLAEYVKGRPWLFTDDSYHIDISHLAAVVRMSMIVSDQDVIALAADLTEYGRRLSPRLLFEGPPPFQQIFDDHGIYLRALLGQEVDRAIDHFQAKLKLDDEAGPEDSLPAQTLVNLLVRVGRVGAAIDVAAAHLADLPDSALTCPSVAQLCQRAGAPERLARIARDHGDLVNFAAARLESTGHDSAVGSGS